MFRNNLSLIYIFTYAHQSHLIEGYIAHFSFTGSGSSLPAHPVNIRGMLGAAPPASPATAPPCGLWTPAACCCMKVQDGTRSVCSGSRHDDSFSPLNSHNLHHSMDNNTNWVIHQISQVKIVIIFVFL